MVVVSELHRSYLCKNNFFIMAFNSKYLDDAKERFALLQPQEPTPRSVMSNSSVKGERVRDLRNGVELEGYIGNEDLFEVSFLEKGLERAKSVCRITVKDDEGNLLENGSGFLIEGQLLVTNHHVLENDLQAKWSIATFNCHLDAEGNPLPQVLFKLQPEQYFRTSPELDLTICKIATRDIHNTNSIDQFGWIKLKSYDSPEFIGRYVNIIQHPLGGYKKLALRENELMEFATVQANLNGQNKHPENFIWYKSDTAFGSSGSPLFNDKWQLVGIHHSGVAEKTPEGLFVCVDGTVMTMEQMRQNPENKLKIKWAANEGIKTNALIDLITKKR